MSEYFRKYIKKFHYSIHPSQIKFKTSFTNCVQSVFQQRGYQQTEDDDWTIYWCQKQFIPETLDKIRLQHKKRVNHFRNYYQICRKDLLAKNIKKFKRTLEKQGKTEEALKYNFIPVTYNLPSEYPIFWEEFRRQKQQSHEVYWIMKPIGKSQGKGIFLFSRICEISDWIDNTNQPEPYIVQRYIHNPLLIGHKKFDLRIYVLVISHSPLTIYLYRSGFGRFTHYRYESNEIKNLESHLTNVAIQKNCDNYDEQKGGKYLLNKLRTYMIGKFSVKPVQQCFQNIQDLIIRTLRSTSSLMSVDKKCFELYGFDVMIDRNLKPWLIQINGSPSLTATTPFDQKLKNDLLDDVLTIIDMEELLAGEEYEVGGFDLIYKNKRRVKNYKSNSSMLGCKNNREKNMRTLAKSVAIRIAQNVRNKQPQTKIQEEKEPSRKKRTITNYSKGTDNSKTGGRSLHSQSNSQSRNKENETRLPKVPELKKQPDNLLRIGNFRDLKK